jgi:hypothetical protein
MRHLRAMLHQKTWQFFLDESKVKIYFLDTPIAFNFLGVRLQWSSKATVLFSLFLNKICK